MTTTGQICGRGVLSATILATKCAKYGLSFSSDLAKQFVAGAQNLANQFAPDGLKLGVGPFLYDKSKEAVLWGLGQVVAIQNNAKKSLN